jgi:hypothetical protein
MKDKFTRFKAVVYRYAGREINLSKLASASHSPIRESRESAKELRRREATKEAVGGDLAKPGSLAQNPPKRRPDKALPRS